MSKSDSKLAIVMCPMYIGGLENSLLSLLNQFEPNRYEITLWVENNSGVSQYYVPEWVRVEYWTEWESGWIKNAWCDGEHCKKSLENLKKLPLLSDEEYDLVIAYQGLVPRIMFTASYRLKSRKRILWIHGEMDYSNGINDVLRDELKLYSKIFCVSKASMDFYTNEFPEVVNKTEIFYNFLNYEEVVEKASYSLDYPLKKNSIVTVGRVSGKKGQAMVPEIVRKLLDRGYDVNWYLVGDGEMREIINNKINELDLSEHLFMMGNQVNPYPFMAQCDIYVQTSISEGWCLAVQEARLLGCSIVVTDIPAMREQICDGVTGMIAKGMSVDALTDAVEILLNNPLLRKTFKENLKKNNVNSRTRMGKLYSLIE